ncbi:MAG: ATP-dependent RecD-like DNA helicase, partial [bacterium]
MNGFSNKNGAPPEIPSDENLESFEGVVDRVVFQNKENGFTVAKFTLLKDAEKISLVGTFPELTEGFPMRVFGVWATHPRFGRQLKVIRYETSLPRSRVGVIRYLSSFIKGVGPVMAKRIVDHFGESTVDVLDKSPKRIREVAGIGGKKADQIVKSWEEHRRMKSVMMFLQSYSIGPGIAMKIYNTYGESAVQVLKENPYLLATDIFGVGFKTADRIALSLGIEKDSPARLEAGVVYSLEAAGNEGHVYLPADELLSFAAQILEVSESKIEDTVSTLIERGDKIVAENDRLYAPNIHYAETVIANRLAAILKERSSKLFKLEISDREVKNVERALGFPMSAQQLSVIEVLSREKAAILTGGPGTGKTISTRAVIHLFENSGFRVLLAAPTGRAAKRMTEATGKPSRTIHRLLEYNPKINSFSRNEDNPLECDLLVVDEMSMIDTMLMYHLIKAVKHVTRVLLVGDVDQLPSVGPGNILRDLIDSGAVPTVRLDTIYRQEAESTIIGNAHLINRGEMPVMATGQGGNFFFTSEEDPEKALEVIVRICADRMPKLFRLDPITDVQVISPMYNGALGVDRLNSALQNRLNPGRDMHCGSRNFRIGDRVMQIKNNYDKDVFNGDVGFIRSVDLAENKLTVDYQETLVDYGFNETDQLVLAYAITVHKSQG